MIATVTDSCHCGAKFSASDRSSLNVGTLHKRWLDVHASCRQQTPSFMGQMLPTRPSSPPTPLPASGSPSLLPQRSSHG